MLISYRRSQGSVILRVKILNSSVTTGAGLTGLLFSSTGLRISTIADNEATATAYTAAGATTETITTLGTYAAPTATKCRFKEVDATSHPGIYEIQFADARFAVASAKSLLLSISGATNAAECDAVIPLTDLDPYDAVRAGLTALPNAAAAAANGLMILGSNNTAAITIGSLTTAAIACTTLTASGAVAFQSTFATTGTTTFNAFTVTNAFTVSGATTFTGNVGMAAGLSVTQSTLNASAIVATGNGTGDGIQAVAGISGVDIRGNITGNLVGTVSTVTTVTGLTASNLDATVSSRMATFTQPTGFLAATFPATVASTTNITAGTITTVTTVTTATNLTNAPTAGDLTAAMKTSVKTQITDALNVDTYVEIGQETPAATNTIRKMLAYLFKAFRNRSTQTATTYKLYNDDAVTVDQKATVSDDATTFDSGEKTTGP